MDMLFDLGLENDVTEIHVRLRTYFGDLTYSTTRTPVGALVKSMISCRTKDEVSLRAYDALVATWPDWQAVVVAGSVAVAAVIHDVTLAEREAGYVCEALRRIGASHPDFDLDFLGVEPVPRAIAWLERLPGVGRKVSAATLNFSTLHRPALVIDTHIQRVFQRTGLVAAKASIDAVYDRVMPDLAHWTAADLSQLHVLVKRLGQVHCHAPAPDCRGCPLGDVCKSYRSRHGLNRGSPFRQTQL
ncbi:endonuclease III [Asticcacaulis sp. 201]|uniref:endonuclease III domain-containing protein n=1 Tax=Asticcacaulis sp. 201 TaxID=3028787 RepID=UPI002916547C|nr:endonuclease III [Asticcacaulis sp. 201]MDV6331385.1 endonuclease III [Asticcacaulis sp. 201]